LKLSLIDEPIKGIQNADSIITIGQDLQKKIKDIDKGKNGNPIAISIAILHQKALIGN
jgi:hypothetical protein